MDRLEELKLKAKEQGGYFGLSKEEQAEYQSLKKGSEVEENKPQAPVEETLNKAEPEKSQSVTLTMAELDALIESKVGKVREESASLKETIESLNLPGQWKTYQAPKESNKTATLRKFREDSDQEYQYIVDWKFLKFIYSEESRKYDNAIYKIKLFSPSTGVTNEIELPLIEFTKINEIETVEIVKMDKKEMYMDQGQVKVATMNKEGYVQGRSVDGGIPGQTSSATVPLRVFAHDISCVVKTKDGKEFSINANRLNQ